MSYAAVASTNKTPVRTMYSDMNFPAPVLPTYRDTSSSASDSDSSKYSDSSEDDVTYPSGSRQPSKRRLTVRRMEILSSSELSPSPSRENEPTWTRFASPSPTARLNWKWHPNTSPGGSSTGTLSRGIESSFLKMGSALACTSSCCGERQALASRATHMRSSPTSTLSPVRIFSGSTDMPENLPSSSMITEADAMKDFSSSSWTFIPSDSQSRVVSGK